MGEGGRGKRGGRSAHTFLNASSPDHHQHHSLTIRFASLSSTDERHRDAAIVLGELFSRSRSRAGGAGGAGGVICFIMLGVCVLLLLHSRVVPRGVETETEREEEGAHTTIPY